MGILTFNCSLHTFASLESQRRKYFKSVAKALIDFQELNPTSPVHMLVDTLNSKKTLPLDTLPTWLRNLGEYMQCIPMDAGIGNSFWVQVVQGIETLFRRIILNQVVILIISLKILITTPKPSLESS